MNIEVMTCCGIKEICDLAEHATPLEAMQSFGNECLEGDMTNYRYAVFSQANHPERPLRNCYGVNFAAYIRRHRLGSVVTTRGKDLINPNSGHLLRAWIWTVDWSAVSKWWSKQPADVKLYCEDNDYDDEYDRLG